MWAGERDGCPVLLKVLFLLTGEETTRGKRRIGGIVGQNNLGCGQWWIKSGWKCRVRDVEFKKHQHSTWHVVDPQGIKPWWSVWKGAEKYEMESRNCLPSSEFSLTQGIEKTEPWTAERNCPPPRPPQSCPGRKFPVLKQEKGGRLYKWQNANTSHVQHKLQLHAFGYF